MTRALRFLTNWRPYAYLAFAIGLLLVEPVTRGVVACAGGQVEQCPGELK